LLFSSFAVQVLATRFLITRSVNLNLPL
jgi:hypothetical protein